MSVMEAGDGVCEVSQIHGGLMMKKEKTTIKNLDFSNFNHEKKCFFILVIQSERRQVTL